MPPEAIQALIDKVQSLEQRVNAFERASRYTFTKDVEFPKDIGVRLGITTSDKVAFYNATPVVQHSSTGEITGHSSVGGTNVQYQDTFNGNNGSKAYTINDIVKALKNFGILAKS